MAGSTHSDDSTDELTEYGILTDYPDATLPDMIDQLGTPLAADETAVVFADEVGHALNEWADTLGVERETLRARCRDVADDLLGEQTAHEWFSYTDPVVFDARTFEEV